jgi:DNA-directed RNA polymerase specialized sigma24 family protein
LSAEALAKFLARLDSDPARAGMEYERLRLILIKFFDWQRVHYPDECADETMNRVIRKIDHGESIQEIPSYCHGLARLVLLETRKKAGWVRSADLDRLPMKLSQAPPEDDERRQICFDRCLMELPIESRQMILQYYSEDKRRKIDRRKALAESLRIPPNALRSRAQRIRRRLEECVEGCLKV